MIAIIDSGGANIASVTHALKRLGQDTVLTADADVIRQAERVILPGVGAARAAMEQLNSKGLVEVVRDLKQPVLGICLGMQLLFSHSEEGDVDMLNIIDGAVRYFDTQADMPIPHMGWNNIIRGSHHPLMTAIDEESYFYFVHSFYAPVNDNTIGVCGYANEFTAVVAKDNFMGCQFHPERSGYEGSKILKNFLAI
ncbi:MAG: imidazole glycerol phosphate synthase subunit HisH [Pseudomonadota bacterium]